MDPVSVDLLDTEFLWGRSVPWLVPLLPFPILRFRRLAAPFPLLRTAGCCSWRGCGFVSSRSVLFPLSFRTHPGIPSLCAPAPLLSFPCPCLLCLSSLRRLLIVPLDLGRDVSALPQTLTGHAGASGLAALALRGLARQRGPTFAAGVDGRTIRSFWCSGVSRRHCLLLLHPLFLLDHD